MSASAIDKELLYYFTQLNEEQKRSLLQMTKNFLYPDNKQSSGVTIEEYNNELQDAEAEYEKGEYISHDEMLKQIGKWENNMK